MERGDHEKGIDMEYEIAMEYELCFIFEKNQDRDECCGASGRKFRRVCINCPNYDRWRQREKREKEGQRHGNESKNFY